MNYFIKLVNGDTIENAQRGMWEEIAESWGWRMFKVNGITRHIPKSSILWMEREPKTKK
jgi:hypothetical protein